MAQPTAPRKGETVIVATGGVVDPPASIAVRNNGDVELSGVVIDADTLSAVLTALAGGDTDQILTKLSDDDYDFAWADPA